MLFKFTPFILGPYIIHLILFTTNVAHVIEKVGRSAISQEYIWFDHNLLDQQIEIKHI